MRFRPVGPRDHPGRPPHIAELFTDRRPESQSFKDALRTFRVLLDSDVDIGESRNNVLAYFGKGGVGKSSLSERLESWVKGELPLLNDGWGPPPSVGVDLAARIDLHDSQGQIDLTSALVALRRAAGQGRRSWPLFDMAFAAYWAAARPDEPMPSLAQKGDLQSTAEQTITDVLTDLGAAATGTTSLVLASKKIANGIREHRLRGLAASAFDGYADLLALCASRPTPTDEKSELLCDLAGVLAWELASLSPAPLFVVFVDTTERLRLDPRRNAEIALNRVVHAMPNVLFVMTGRDALDWYDPRRIDLAHRGATVWPGLVPTCDVEPRQHRLHNLSDSDATRVMVRSRETFGLNLTDAVIREVVASSYGLPQYLELARQVAITIRDNDPRRLVAAADVAGTLGQLVQRVLEDVAEDEQRALRAATLFRSFDEGLVAAASGESNGCVERAVLRPMVDHFPGSALPYRIHDEIRAAIRSADAHVAGGWAAGDWRLAATLAAREAHRRHERAKTAGADEEVVHAISVAITVVCEEDAELEPAASEPYLNWLSRAIVYAPSLRSLEPHVPVKSKTPSGQGYLDFLAGKSTMHSPDEREAKLSALFRQVTHPMSLPAGRHLHYHLRQESRWDEAMDVWRQLVRLSPTLVNRRQGSVTLSLARRFREALAAVPEDDDMSSVRRTIEYCHGKPDAYFAAVIPKITRLREAGRDREAIGDEADLLQRRAFFLGVSRQEVIDFTRRVDSVGHAVGVRAARVAAVLHDPLADDVPQTLEYLHDLDTLHLGRIGFRFATAALVVSLTRPSVVTTASVAAAVRDVRVSNRSRSWVPVEMMLEHLGHNVGEPPTDWLEARDVVRRRWASHLGAYLERLAVARPAGRAADDT